MSPSNWKYIFQILCAFALRISFDFKRINTQRWFTYLFCYFYNSKFTNGRFLGKTRVKKKKKKCTPWFKPFIFNLKFGQNLSVETKVDWSHKFYLFLEILSCLTAGYSLLCVRKRYIFVWSSLLYHIGLKKSFSQNYNNLWCRQLLLAKCYSDTKRYLGDESIIKNPWHSKNSLKPCILRHPVS